MSSLNTTAATVIPWYHDDIADLRNHLAATLEQKFPPIQVIVVNDGTDFDLSPVLRGYRQEGHTILLANILEDIPWNVSGAKNLGISLAKTEYISIEDCDTIPQPDYLDSALRYLSLHSECHRWKCAGKQLRDGIGYPSLPGSFVCRRKDIMEAGCFNEEFAGNWGCEDIELEARMPVQYVDNRQLTRLADVRTAERDCTVNRAKQNYFIQCKVKPAKWLNFQWVVKKIE